jgi:hypothetical protein
VTDVDLRVRRCGHAAPRHREGECDETRRAPLNLSAPITSPPP